MSTEKRMLLNHTDENSSKSLSNSSAGRQKGEELLNIVFFFLLLSVRVHFSATHLYLLLSLNRKWRRKHAVIGDIVRKKDIMVHYHFTLRDNLGWCLIFTGTVQSHNRITERSCNVAHTVVLSYWTLVLVSRPLLEGLSLVWGVFTGPGISLGLDGLGILIQTSVD